MDPLGQVPLDPAAGYTVPQIAAAGLLVQAFHLQEHYPLIGRLEDRTWHILEQIHNLQGGFEGFQAPPEHAPVPAFVQEMLTGAVGSILGELNIRSEHTIQLTEQILLQAAREEGPRLRGMWVFAQAKRAGLFDRVLPTSEWVLIQLEGPRPTEKIADARRRMRRVVNQRIDQLVLAEELRQAHVTQEIEGLRQAAEGRRQDFRSTQVSLDFFSIFLLHQNPELTVPGALRTLATIGVPLDEQEFYSAARVVANLSGIRRHRR